MDIPGDNAKPTPEAVLQRQYADVIADWPTFVPFLNEYRREVIVELIKRGYGTMLSDAEIFRLICCWILENSALETAQQIACERGM